jgi:hypothetical protein
VTEVDTTNTTNGADDVMPGSTRFTANEIARAWRVAPATIRRWARRGMLPSRRSPGGRVTFGADALPPTEPAA